ncbi:hypothetical protein J4207_06545 [Candidatus Woesearchaeota archaeon]|nr:hypothetical protein [Candidatus Woesearchaeota archaeon]
MDIVLEREVRRSTEGSRAIFCGIRHDISKSAVVSRAVPNPIDWTSPMIDGAGNATYFRTGNQHYVMPEKSIEPKQLTYVPPTN